MTNFVDAGRPPLEQLYAAAVVALYTSAHDTMSPPIDTPTTTIGRHAIDVLARVKTLTMHLEDCNGTLEPKLAELKARGQSQEGTVLQGQIDALKQDIAQMQAELDRHRAEHPLLVAAWNEYIEYKELAILRSQLAHADNCLHVAEEQAQWAEERRQRSSIAIEEMCRDRNRILGKYEALQRAIGAQDE